MNKLRQFARQFWNHRARAIFWSVAALGIGLVMFWAAFPHAAPQWTGFGEYQNARGDIERAKTLWDWMSLLIVPVVLAIGVWWLNKAEKTTEQTIAKARSEEETLQTYLGHMSELLLKENLRESAETDEVRSIARSRTLTALRGLDGLRKGLLVRFLWESGIILGSQLVKLKGAELTGVDLRHANLTGADFAFADLSKAILLKTRLSTANLSKTLLVDADLSEADLVAANLHFADLTRANLAHSALAEADFGLANLEKANLTHAHLRRANLRGAKLLRADLSFADLTETDLTRAQLRRTRLRNANLSDAILRGANLQYADLRGAILDNADLSLADLTGAKVRSEQLTKVSSLAVAIMINGKPINGENL